MKQEYHHGNLRAALVEAAARLAAERGIESLSLREAAREAGVSHAAPYHHFKNKEGLIAAVAEEGFRRFDAYQERALKSANANPPDQLTALGRAYVRFALANPHFFRIMFRENFQKSANFPELREISERTFQRLVKTVQSCGTNQPGDRPGEPDPDVIAAWSLVHGLSLLLLDGPLKEFAGRKTKVDRLIDSTISSMPFFSKNG